MLSQDILRSEAAHYQTLATRLRTDYLGIDDETLTDTLEGLSDLPDMIKEVVRSSLEDECLAESLKGRMAQMSVRLSRLQDRIDKKRQLACWAMGAAGVERLMADDFSVGLRQGLAKLEVVDESRVPQSYLVPQPAKLDRSGLLAALKRGEPADGARLVLGAPHIAVRTK